MNAIKILIGIVLTIITMSGAMAASYWYDDYNGQRNVNYNYQGYSTSPHLRAYPQMGYNYARNINYNPYGYNTAPYNQYYGSANSYRSNINSYHYNPYRYQNSYSYRPTSTGMSNYAYNTRNSQGYGSYGGYSSGYYGNTGTYGGASQPVLFNGYQQEYTGYNRYY